MSNVIKIGNLTIDSFKVGAADCSIYLGTTKLYPQGEPPTPVGFKYKLTLSNGDIVSAETDATSAITRNEVSAYSATCVSAEINDCVTNIDASAFLNFTNIRNISLPDSLTTIGDYAFYHCTKLTGLTIPSGVTTIGQQILAFTENISSLTVYPTTPPTIAKNALGSKIFPIYVPCESVEAYKQASGWSSYSSRISCIPAHEYVDLGLPSGTKWATMNVGASSETDYGNYYQYGKGADDYQVTSGQSDYSGTENPLAASADTATQAWGGSWHTPTQAQFEELTANTTYEWTTINGVNGGKFTAQNGNYVFFPAAGKYDWRGYLMYDGNMCYYRSSSFYQDTTSCTPRFENGSVLVSFGVQHKEGCSIRPVMDN